MTTASSSSSSVRIGQFLCFSLVWLSYCSTYFLRKPLGVVKSDMATDLNLGKSELGWCDTALVLPYALVQIFFASLTDKYPPRHVLATCLFLAGLITWLTYSVLSAYLLGLWLGLVLTGALLAPCWPAATASLSSWFPDDQLNFIFGLINTATYSGGLGGTALAAAILEYSSWKDVGAIPAAIAVTAAGLVSHLLKAPVERGVTVPNKLLKVPDDVSKANNDSLLTIFKISCVKELSVSMFCLKFVRYCMAMWLPLFLLEHLGYSKLQAGIFSTVFDVGGIIGSPLLGVLLDKYYLNNPLLGVTYTMLFGTIVITLFICTANLGIGFNCLFLLLAGATNCGPDSMIAGSISVNIGDKRGQGRGGAVTSFVNGVGNVGGIVEGPIIGFLWTLVGWDGVLLALVGVSALGTISTYKAFKLDKSSSLLPR